MTGRGRLIATYRISRRLREKKPAPTGAVPGDGV